MTKAEKLEFWAGILEKPWMDCERSKEFPFGRMRDALECNQLAAEAMRFMATWLTQKSGTV